MSKTEIIFQVEPKTVNFKTASLAVLKLIARIYKAFEQNNYKATKKLQKTLAKSWSYQVFAQNNLFLPIASFRGLKNKAPARTKQQYLLQINFNNSTQWTSIKNYLVMIALNNLITSEHIIMSKDQVIIFGLDKSCLLNCENILKNWLKLWLQSVEIKLINAGENRFQKNLVKSCYRRLASCCDRLKGAKQIELIKQLNLIMRFNYQDYLFCCPAKVLRLLDYLLAKKLYRWAIHRHPRKGKQWIVNQYWHLANTSKWRFCVGEICLKRHLDFA